MHRDRGRTQCEVNGGVVGCRMDGDQFIDLFKQGLGDLIGQFLVHFVIYEQNVRGRDGVNRCGHAFVDAGAQGIRREGRFCIKCGKDFVISERNQLDVARGCKVQDRAGGRADAPETGINVTIADRISGFVEVQTLFVDVIIGDAIGFEQGFGRNFGPRTRCANRNAFALKVGKAVDAAVSKGYELYGVRIDRCQCANVVERAAFEFAGAGVTRRYRPMAMSLSPRATRPMFSTDAPVTSATALEPSTYLVISSARPPPYG